MARVLKVCVPNTRFAIVVIIHEVDLHVTNNNRSAYWQGQNGTTTFDAAHKAFVNSQRVLNKVQEALV